MPSIMKFYSQICTLFAAAFIVIALAGCRQETHQTPPLSPRLLTTVEKNIADYDINTQGLIALLDGEPGEYGERQLVLIGKDGIPQKIKSEIADAALYNIKFSPDGRLLIGSNRWGLWIGEIEGEQIKRHFSTKVQKTALKEYGITYSPYQLEKGIISSLSLYGDHSFKVRRWKAADSSFMGEETFTLARKGSLTVTFFRLSRDGKKAIIVWEDKQEGQHIERYPAGSIEIWEIATRRRLQTLEPIMPLELEAPIFSDDTKYVAATDGLGRGYIWDTQTGKLIQTLSGLRRKIEGRPDGYSPKFTSSFLQTASLVFMPDNHTVLATILDGYILAYDVESGIPIKILEKRANHVHSRLSPNARDLFFVEDRRILYALPLPEFGTTEQN